MLLELEARPDDARLERERLLDEVGVDLLERHACVWRGAKSASSAGANGRTAASFWARS